MKTHAAAVAAITLAAGLLGAAVSRPGAAARREQVPWATLAVSRSVLVGGGVYVVGRGQNRLVHRAPQTLPGLPTAAGSRTRRPARGTRRCLRRRCERHSHRWDHAHR